MSKTKAIAVSVKGIVLLVALAIMVFLSLASLASAKEGNDNDKQERKELKLEAKVNAGVKISDDRSGRTGDNDGDEDSATSTRRGKDDDKNDDKGGWRAFMNASSTASTSAQWKMNGERMDNFVEKLRDMAKKHRDIGDDLEKIANAQASSTVAASSSVVKIKGESKIKRFFLGTDIKNLGMLRSVIVTTENQIDRLTKLKERVSDPAVKADIDAQIQVLAQTATDTKLFIQTHESSFSLFGWVRKLLDR